MALSIDYSEFRAFDVALRAKFDANVARAGGVLRHWGQLLWTQVNRNASTGQHEPGEPHIPGTGPGPNRATGDYLRTIGLEFSIAGPLVSASVGSSAPQARRLEFGFSGSDSLGRHYNQPPYPHFGPALDYIEPLFLDAVVAMGAL